MNPKEIDLYVTSNYLSLETLAFIIGINVSFMNVVFIIIGKDKNVYIFLIVSTILSILTDLIFIPSFKIYGIAISNIIVNSILSLISFILLYAQKSIQFCWFHKCDFMIIKEWFKVGFFSGIQQFIDNFIYAIMICKMVNMVANQGNYWIANNFIWGWLLIPITALTEIIRSDCKEGYNKKNRSNYNFIAFFVVVFWIVTVPFWLPFYQYVENLENANEIFLITIKLSLFYIAYIGAAIIDNIFIGLGKTSYNAVNSIIINFVYYGVFYILYLTNAISFTMNVIIIMFGFGMVFHWIISFIEEKIFLKKQKSLVFNTNI